MSAFGNPFLRCAYASYGFPTLYVLLATTTRSVLSATQVTTTRPLHPRTTTTLPYSLRTLLHVDICAQAWFSSTPRWPPASPSSPPPPRRHYRRTL